MILTRMRKTTKHKNPKHKCKNRELHKTMLKGTLELLKLRADWRPYETLSFAICHLFALVILVSLLVFGLLRCSGFVHLMVCILHIACLLACLLACLPACLLAH